MRPLRLALASAFALVALSSAAQAAGPRAGWDVTVQLDDDVVGIGLDDDAFRDDGVLRDDDDAFRDDGALRDDDAGLDDGCDVAPDRVRHDRMRPDRERPRATRVTSERRRAPVPRGRTFPVKILWGGSWYDGTVLAREAGRYYVHYTGYSDSWDEWVTRDRLQFVGRDRERPRHAAAPGAVQILWGGQWWNGRVLEQRGDRYLITYDGYAASWNEWVGPDRLRRRQ